MERICANCGAKSDEDTSFCTKCGVQYLTPEEQQLKIANEHLKDHPLPPQTEAARQDTRQLATSQALATIGAFLFMIFFLCVGLFVYFIFFVNQSGGVDKQAALQFCLSTAQDTYSQDWNTECIAEGGAENEGLNCKINIAQATLLDNRLQDAKDNCYHTYPQ